MALTSEIANEGPLVNLLGRQQLAFRLCMDKTESRNKGSKALGIIRPLSAGEEMEAEARLHAACPDTASLGGSSNLNAVTCSTQATLPQGPQALRTACLPPA